MTDNRIPTDGSHRGVGLHHGQSEQRLGVVRRDIDRVHGIGGAEALLAFARDTGNAPEARLFARAKGLAVLDDAMDRRAPRSRAANIELRESLTAAARGLASLTWRSPTHYASKLDLRSKPGEPDRRIPREKPLAE